MEMLFVAATSSAVLVCWMVVRHLTGAWIPVRPTILGVGFVGLLVTHYLSSVFLLGAPDYPRALRFHLAVTVCLVAVTFGATLANAAVKLRASEIIDFYERAAHSKPTRRDMRAIVALGVVCALVLVAFATQADSYPLQALLAGESTRRVNELRALAMGSDSGSPFWYVFGMFRVAVMPLLFVLSALMWPQTRGKPFVRFALGSGIAVTLIYNSWSSAKTPVVMLVLLFMLAVLIKRPRKRNFRQAHGRTVVVLVLAGTIAIGYPMFIFSMKAFGQTASTEEVFIEGIVNRVARKPALLSYTQFELFPDRVPFTEFRDVALLSALLDREYFNLSRATALLSQGIISNAPPASPGNLYAQGGWAVLLAGSALMGATLQFMQAWTVRRLPASPVAVGLLSLFCWGAFRLSMTSFHSIVMSEAVVPGILCAWVWRSYRRSDDRQLERSIEAVPTATAPGAVQPLHPVPIGRE